MSQIDVEHLQRTLAHPLLKSIFIKYCNPDPLIKNSLEFWLAVNDLESVFDDVWLQIRSRSLFYIYLADRKLPISDSIFNQLENKIKSKKYSTCLKLFEEAQQEIFICPLRDTLRKFLQSGVYHEQYEQLRKGLLFVGLRNGKGFESQRAFIYCDIRIGNIINKSTLSSTVNNNWKDEDDIHKFEIIPNNSDEITFEVYLRNESCWGTDKLIGKTSILLNEIWDEIPKVVWKDIIPVKVDGEIIFSNSKIEIGLVLIHRPDLGFHAGELNFTSPLASSCSYGHYGAVKKLLADGHSIDERVEASNRTALHVSVIKNRTPIVQLLLHEEADPNLVDSHSQTALHLAAQFAPNLCHLLVTAGARVDIKELFHNGQTALHMLATHNYVDAAKYLIVKNANVNSKTADGITPLHKAISQKSFGVVKLLLEHNADLNILNEDNISPLQLAEKLNTSKKGNQIYKFVNEYKLNKVTKPPKRRTLSVKSMKKVLH